MLASHPEEVRSFYEDTIAPLRPLRRAVRVTELVATLEAWFAHELQHDRGHRRARSSLHRHTVAYRLERVKELTQLDPMLSEDRERLGLGLKAYRIIAPRLPK